MPFLTQSIELEIDALASDGRGLGRFKNQVIFVSNTVPGQRVVVSVTSKHQKFLEGNLCQVLRPSPYEQKAPCKHIVECGGCSWQHIQYKEQIFWKQCIVKDALERIGKVHNPNVLSTIASPNEWNYRNKMEFVFVSGKDTDGGPLIGLRMRRSHRIVAITDCLVASANSMKILAAVRKWVANNNFSTKNNLLAKGYYRFLVIREVSEGSCLVELIVNTFDRVKIPCSEQEHCHQFSVELCRELFCIKGVIVSRRKALSNVAYGEETIWQSGKVFLKEQLGSIALFMGHNSFFQVNPSATELLYLEILRMANLTGKEEIWDLYCGVGSIALFLAAFVRKVIGVDSIHSAINLARLNTMHLGYSNCLFNDRDVGSFIEDQNRKGIVPDLAIVDPPRAGLDEKTRKALIQLAPQRCIYVSCNPGTLARDIANLTPYFSICETRPVDLFPHTPHIETISLLTYNGYY